MKSNPTEEFIAFMERKHDRPLQTQEQCEQLVFEVFIDAVGDYFGRDISKENGME